jgi:hypothetical protein
VVGFCKKKNTSISHPHIFLIFCFCPIRLLLETASIALLSLLPHQLSCVWSPLAARAAVAAIFDAENDQTGVGFGNWRGGINTQACAMIL